MTGSGGIRTLSRSTRENDSDFGVRAFFFYIDYEIHPFIDATAGRFHAWWNREVTEVHPETGETEWQIVAPEGNNPGDENNYVFADIEGKGHFVGIHYYVDSPGPMWYGEGDDMWRIDGEPWPGSLHGTGTEDFFNGSWCPNELYSHPYFGYARITDNSDGWAARTATGSSWWIRFISTVRSKPASSTGMTIISRWTLARWPTGTKASRINLFRK